MPEPVALCFSGGKDSVLALRALALQGQYAVDTLLTTVTSGYERVSMHGVRRALVQAQAAALGTRLVEVEVPPASSNLAYEAAMGAALHDLRARGVRRVAFGDIFLEDLRTYREDRLASVDMEGLFPLWKRNTTDLARSFVDDGFEAILVCVNPAVLDASFAGRSFDSALLSDLPAGVDPCGENGEFHTFVWTGPTFRHPIAVSPGVIVERDGFLFCDLHPTDRGV